VISFKPIKFIRILSQCSKIKFVRIPRVFLGKKMTKLKKIPVNFVYQIENTIFVFKKDISFNISSLNLKEKSFCKELFIKYKIMNNLIIEGFYNYDKYSMYVLRIDWCRLFLHNLAHFCKTISSKYRIR